MKYLKIFIRNFKLNWKSGLLKIITLGLGLTFGLILLAKVFFDYSYEQFYPDLNEIYIIEQGYQVEDTPEYERTGIPGAIAPGMKAEVAGVEIATRITGLGNLLFKSDIDKEFTVSAILADSCFYDILPRPMIVGNPKEILTIEGKVMISSSLANKIGKEVVGKIITFEKKPNQPFVIEGVFKDVPYNSSIQYDMVISLPSIRYFMYDGSLNWMGNDRYLGLVKLAKSVDPLTLAPAIRAMQEKHQDMERLRKYNSDLYYNLLPFSTYYRSSDMVQHRSVILGTIAFILLFICVINYVMLTTLTVVSKSKEIALHKCYGAENKDIIKMVYWETFFYMIQSLILFALFLFASHDYLDRLIGEQIAIFFTCYTAFLLLGVCVLVFILTGVLPAYFYMKLPTLDAIKKDKKFGRKWKQALLVVQFIAVTALLAFLLQIEIQFKGVLKEDLGYKTENLLYLGFSSSNTHQRISIIDELKKLPCIKEVTTGSEYPFMWPSGNNILLPNSDQELFNIGDLYFVQESYLETMGIELIEGENFHANSQKNDVLVSDDFISFLGKHIDIRDGVVGRELIITEHGLCKIIGVYKRIKVTSVLNSDKRATVIFHKAEPQNILFMRLNELTTSTKALVDKTIQQVTENTNIETSIYSQTIENIYADTKQLQKIISLGVVIAFLFVVIGLVGYTQSEIKRRSKEIAIRKINGASFKDLMQLLSRSIFYLALLSIALGCVLAYIAAKKWMQDFDFQLFMPIHYYIYVGVFVVGLILGLTYLQLRMIARMNPVDALKAE